MPVGDRPRRPQLSAAAVKASARPPLTPKIATQGATVLTLAARKAQNQTPTLGTSTGLKNDVPNPLAPSLAANVTPRSGTRQSRVDGSGTTPYGTPNTHDLRPGIGVSGVTFESPRPAPSTEAPAEANDSKFFYASDARSSQLPATQSRSTPQLVKQPTFFYANGAQAEGSQPAAATSTTSLPLLAAPSAAPESSNPKFFYANDASEHGARSTIPNSNSGSTMSSLSKAPIGRLSTSNSVVSQSPATVARPSSPVKHSLPPLQQLRSLPNSPAPSNHQPPVIPPATMAGVDTSPSSNAHGRRRVSIGTPPRPPRGHQRTESTPIAESTSASFFASPMHSQYESVSPPRSPISPQPAMTMASLLQAVEDLDPEGTVRETESGMPSPTKSISSTDPISELVANARRERKVQDLEITNASLEAINRTLERQLRKQTAELRRYRRLSRSGRLSLISGASSRVTSTTLTDAPTIMTDLSEEEDVMDGAEGQDSVEESDFSSDEDVLSIESGQILSPSTRAVARRQRDERRLQLDLSKHQELLIDSQKMNQSIKRCLDWTQVLIKEGQKALEYHVMVSDVQLGGKVLPPVDDYYDDEASQLSTRAPAVVPGSDPAVGELVPTWDKAVQDRDSGIEFPVDAG